MLAMALPTLIIAYGLAEILGIFDCDSSDDDDSESQSQDEEVQTITGVIDESGGNFAGGPGNDDVRGSPGDDVLRGNEGNDTLFGDAGADTLFGDAGDDILNGDQADTLTGGPGDDTFIVSQTDITDTAAQITDFEDGEVIRIVVPEATASDTLSTRLSEDGTATEIVFREEIMAVLQGVTTPGSVTAQLTPNVFLS